MYTFQPVTEHNGFFYAGFHCIAIVGSFYSNNTNYMYSMKYHDFPTTLYTTRKNLMDIIGAYIQIALVILELFFAIVSTLSLPQLHCYTVVMCSSNLNENESSLAVPYTVMVLTTLYNIL